MDVGSWERLSGQCSRVHISYSYIVAGDAASLLCSVSSLPVNQRHHMVTQRN